MTCGARRRFGRPAVVVLVLALTTPSAIALAAPRQDPFSPGLAAAQARVQRVNPTAAALSVGVTTGMSLAGHQNHSGGSL